ncbi:MAG TPA: T9SS type A sorting domain-containing protein, partial [Flavobacteriales bacterium]|nr:T9SS type A sorting domain-containing protein [Flavobacteriales bacterium]
EVLEEGAELQRWVPYYLAMGDLAAADSVIQLLVDAEGGDPSLTTQLYQLRLSVLSGLNQQDPAYVTWLRELIEADPYGAMAPKALLRHVTREPYMRCPWKLNDDLPGIRSMETGQRLEPPPLRMHPNPGNGDFTITLPGDLTVTQCALWTTDGRRVAVRYSAGRLDATGAAPGTYIADLVLSDGHREQQRVVILPQ